MHKTAALGADDPVPARGPVLWLPMDRVSPSH